MFIIFILASSPNYAVAIEPNDPHEPNALWMEPSTASVYTAGEKFNLTIWLNITEECFAWQLKILFNPTHFNVSRVGYTNGEKSDFFSDHATITITPILNYSQGHVIVGETLLENDTRSPGFGSLLWIEFSVNDPPTHGLSVIEFSEPYGVDIFILDPYLDTIALDQVERAEISILQTPQDNLVRDIILVAIIGGILIIVAIGIAKRRRAKTVE